MVKFDVDKNRNKILLGNCFDYLEKMDNEVFDLAILDPPYGDDDGYGRLGKEILNNEDVKINYDILKALYPKMKNNTSCYIFTNWKFERLIRNFVENENLFTVKHLICIVKNNIGMGFAFRHTHEFCIILEKGKPEYNTFDFSDVQPMDNIQHYDISHPHEKGLEMLKKIIEHSSKVGDLIFDPTSGSGSTAIAAYELHRDFLCIELDETYWERSNKRYEVANVEEKRYVDPARKKHRKTSPLIGK